MRDSRILPEADRGDCRAADEETVARLRARKHREDKPFALLVADLDAARELVAVDPVAAELLTSRRRPIVTYMNAWKSIGRLTCYTTGRVGGRRSAQNATHPTR